MYPSRDLDLFWSTCVLAMVIAVMAGAYSVSYHQAYGHWPW